MNKLKVHSIFKSISGECGYFRQGSWVTFIRLDGCNLRCSYCDTKETQEGNSHLEMSVEQVMDSVRKLSCSQVLITGGEPLLQKEGLTELINVLQEDYDISIETNGSINPGKLMEEEIYWIFDYKLSGSGQLEKMMELSEFQQIAEDSAVPIFIKFVIKGIMDYQQAFTVYSYLDFKNITFSACAPLMHNQLFQWMREYNLDDVLLNVQIHKLANLKEK